MWGELGLLRSPPPKNRMEAEAAFLAEKMGLFAGTRPTTLLDYSFPIGFFRDPASLCGFAKRWRRQPEGRILKKSTPIPADADFPPPFLLLCKYCSFQFSNTLTSFSFQKRVRGGGPRALQTTLALPPPKIFGLSAPPPPFPRSPSGLLSLLSAMERCIKKKNARKSGLWIKYEKYRGYGIQR